MEKADILIVDDIPENLRFLSKVLEEEGYFVRPVTDGNRALTAAQTKVPDLILLDVRMPGTNGYDVCTKLKADKNLCEIPVIFISALDKTFDKTKGFACGGVDYITKPFAAEEVLARIETHLKIYRLTQELQQTIAELKNEIARREQAEQALSDADERLSTISEEEAKHWGIPNFIGKSRTMVKILDDVCKLQNFNTSILITGESGTGKELVARAIHFGGNRQRGPFVPVNCCAIPEDLFESICFGHIQGAFTGATKNRKGLFECAHRGTLFLDEIGDMQRSLQAKMLRVLEEGDITPLGSNTAKKIDIRIIAATNSNLAQKIIQGSFRQDLYFRLAGFTVNLPPLRERQDDIPLLVFHFLAMFAQEIGREQPELTREALNALQNYAYPGNIRELKNIVENALIKCSSQLQKQHLNLIETALSPRAPRKEPMPEALNLRNVDHDEQRILKYIRDNGAITNKLCRDLLQSDLHQASYLLKKMHRNGLLIREGKYRWSYYRLP